MQEQQNIDLLSMLPEELADYLASIGEPKYRAEQIFSQFAQGRTISEMTNLPRTLRERLVSTTAERMPTVREEKISAIDGTVKYLFSLFDGETVESVLMRYRHGNTLCISSQVGCRMGCAFCASTVGGRIRDLYPSELLGQILAAERASGEKISNVVMMGIGEPLDNYDHVIRFLRLVNHPKGLCIGYRHISLSTCGVVSGIYALAEEAFPITLSISLHAVTDAERSAIMPINRKYPLSKLMEACRAYYTKTGRRISFEYTLIAGKNDTSAHALQLAKLLKTSFRGTDAPLHVNLIRVNPVEGTGFARGTKESAEAFQRVLMREGVVATVRRRLGSDVNGACGQLRRADAKTRLEEAQKIKGSKKEGGENV